MMIEMMSALFAAMESHINALVDQRVSLALANAIEYPEGILNKTIDLQISNALSSQDFEMTLTRLVNANVEEAVNNLDIGQQVEEAVNNLDIEQKVEEAVNNLDIGQQVEEAVNNLTFEVSVR